MAIYLEGTEENMTSFRTVGVLMMVQMIYFEYWPTLLHYLLSSVNTVSITLLLHYFLCQLAQ